MTVFSKTDLARVLGFSDTHIDQLCNDGAPVIQRGGPGRAWKIDSAAFMDWYIKRKQAAATNDFGRIKTHVMTLRARQRELKAEDMENRLVPAVEVAAYLRGAYVAIRRRFAAVESQVPGLTDEQRQQLRSAIADSVADSRGDKPKEWGHDA